MNKNLAKTEEQLDALEQYGRRDNLEIHNIPWTKNENKNEIVKKIANTLNVKLDDHDISTSHRIYSNQTPKPNSPNINLKQTEAGGYEHPPIIVRFVNRDKRNEQARSQDLEKGGGYFERVRSVQTTLTQIFIDLESISDGLSET